MVVSIGCNQQFIYNNGNITGISPFLKGFNLATKNHGTNHGNYPQKLRYNHLKMAEIRPVPLLTDVTVRSLYFILSYIMCEQ